MSEKTYILLRRLSGVMSIRKAISKVSPNIKTIEYDFKPLLAKDKKIYEVSLLNGKKQFFSKLPITSIAENGYLIKRFSRNPDNVIISPVPVFSTGAIAYVDGFDYMKLVDTELPRGSIRIEIGKRIKKPKGQKAAESFDKKLIKIYGELVKNSRDFGSFVYIKDAREIAYRKFGLSRSAFDKGFCTFYKNNVKMIEIGQGISSGLTLDDCVTCSTEIGDIPVYYFMIKSKKMNIPSF